MVGSNLGTQPFSKDPGDLRVANRISHSDQHWVSETFLTKLAKSWPWINQLQMKKKKTKAKGTKDNLDTNNKPSLSKKALIKYVMDKTLQLSLYISS